MLRAVLSIPGHVGCSPVLAVLPWPKNSPESNPIKNLLENYEHRVSVMQPTTKTKLIEHSGMKELCHASTVCMEACNDSSSDFSKRRAFDQILL